MINLMVNLMVSGQWLMVNGEFNC